MRIAFTVLIAVLTIVVVLLLRRQREAPAAKPAPALAPRSDQPAGAFGYKSTWLAVRSNSSQDVIAALNLANVRPASWTEGTRSASDGAVFISPPVSGWVFVVSMLLPDAGDDSRPDELTPWLKHLSATLQTTVQYFATHRVVEFQSWAWAERGELKRAFSYIGEQGIIPTDIGTPTPAERELGFKFTVDDPPDEEHVLQLAGKWSVNPMTLDPRSLPNGWVGERRQ